MSITHTILDRLKTLGKGWKFAPQVLSLLKLTLRVLDRVTELLLHFDKRKLPPTLSVTLWRVCQPQHLGLFLASIREIVRQISQILLVLSTVAIKPVSALDLNLITAD